MGNTPILFNGGLFSILRKKRLMRRLDKHNEIMKQIRQYEKSDVEGFIQRNIQNVSDIGNYLLSGEMATYRSRGIACIAAECARFGFPVVILHEGNRELEQEVGNVAPGVFLHAGNACYDPFYNREDNSICNMIMNATTESTKINNEGRQYILGISRFIRSKKIPPYFDMFARCPYDLIVDKVDEAETQGYLPKQEAAMIRSFVMQGQGERYNVQSFFSELSLQGGFLFAGKMDRAQTTNIKDAVEKGNAIMIDIGSSTNDLLLNVVIHEIREMLSNGRRLMLMIDSLNLDTNENLRKLVRSMPSNLVIALSATDIYSMIGADDNLFKVLTSQAVQRFVFRHTSGVSAEKWAETFGVYEASIVSQNVGDNSSGTFFSRNSGRSDSITLTRNREQIVKSEDIMHLDDYEMYMFDKLANETAFVRLN